MPGTFEVYILLSIEPKSAMERIERKLLRISRLYELMEVLGPYEVLAKFRFRTKEQLVNTIHDLSKMDGVKDFLVLVTTKKLKIRVKEALID